MYMYIYICIHILGFFPRSYSIHSRMAVRFEVWTLRSASVGLGSKRLSLGATFQVLFRGCRTQVYKLGDSTLLSLII